MCSCNHFVCIRPCGLRRRYTISWDDSWERIRQGHRLVRFEYIQTFQLLVYDCQRLEFLRLDDLLVEPILDLILLYLWEFLVIIVEMSIKKLAIDQHHRL
jgi:hypothetical protein